MARVPMVTRTIVATKANVMCLDVQAGEPCNHVVTVPRTYKDDEALMKKVRPLIETETLKAVHIVDKEEIETQIKELGIEGDEEKAYNFIDFRSFF